jgi:condensin-2 complex subunit D3
MTTSTALLDTFQSLLDSSSSHGNNNNYFDYDAYDDDDGGANLMNDSSYMMGNGEEQQGALCHQLHQLLQKEQQQAAKNDCATRRSSDEISEENADPNLGQDINAPSATVKSIRELFPDTRMADLLPTVVTPLLNARVETQELLPATQDVDANAEVLNDTAALSLTVPALQAGLLYAHLLSRPGALGSGLVDLEPLTALVALIRRWNTECCGREKDALGAAGVNSCRNGMSPSKSPPKKRAKRGGRSDDEGYDEMDEDEECDGDPPSETNVLVLGGLVALEFCKIPQQSELSSWSSEGREIVLDGVVAAMGTAAALHAGNDGSDTLRTIISESKKSMKYCLAVPSGQAKNHQFQLQRHESSVVILRGLMHLLQLKVVLPNGERGIHEAHNVACEILASLMKRANQTIKAITPTFSIKTPIRTAPRSSLGSMTKTPKSAVRNQRRPSLDSTIPITSPVLKKQVSRMSISAPAVNEAKPRGVPAVFLGLLQKLSTLRSGLEKATLRKSTIKAIQSCLEWMPHTERTHFLRYMLKICHSKVSVHRLVACELLGGILSQEWLVEHKNDCVEDDLEDSDDEHSSPSSTEEQNIVTNRLPQALWKALRGRLIDRVGSVRASAAASLEYAASAAPNQMGGTMNCFVNDDGEKLLIALRKRAVKDETATVRKAAVMAMTKLLVAQKEGFSEFHLAAICDLCQDASLLTRRAAAESLTTLLQVFSEAVDNEGAQDVHNRIYSLGLVEEAWSACVLPMVLDEDTCVKAVNAFERIVLSPIVEEDTASAGKKQASAWRILASVGNLSSQCGASKNASQALEKALSHIAKEDSSLIHSKLMKIATNMASKTLEDQNMTELTVVGVWCLMEALLNLGKTNQKRKSNHLGFCTSAWEIMLKRSFNMPGSSPLRSTLKSTLIVLSKCAKSMTTADAESCQARLLKSLIQYSFPPDLIGSAVAALFELNTGLWNGKENEDSYSWIRTAFSYCEEEIGNFLQEIQDASEISGFEIIKRREQKVVRALFTAGELSIAGFRPEDDESSGASSLHVPLSAHLKEFVQILVSDCLPGTHHMKIPTSIRAHAFTVLGKFCLRDVTMARSSLTVLARELHPSIANTNPSIQSNALLVLGDLCIRYTNMTDRYLPIMASCLQNGMSETETSLMCRSSVVRKHAVLLLSSLLLQDYIKWRGLLFHRFLVACCDEDDEVATLAETVLTGPLWVRSPKLFFNHFVEAIFVLNRCTAHPIYIAAASQGDGGSGIAVGFDGINLNGPGGEAKRRLMYDFLLSKLSDEEKIGVTARLAKEVLGGAVETSGDLSRVCQGPPPNSSTSSPRVLSAWNVLLDTFYVLTNKAIKVGKVQDDSDAAALEDPNLPNAMRQVTVAKTRLLSKISLKHMMEIVLPILCQLKVKLQASNSPLLKDLMTYLLEIFRNYKTEVKEFLANDPTLLQEIEYDARQLRKDGGK